MERTMAEVLRGQVAIVTGASRGLGRHIALQLAQKGVRVAVTARSEADLQRVAKARKMPPEAIVFLMRQRTNSRGGQRE